MRRQKRMEMQAREESRLTSQVEASILRLFSRPLLSESVVNGSDADRQLIPAQIERRVLWSPRQVENSHEVDKSNVAADQRPGAGNSDAEPVPRTPCPRSLRLQAQLACLDRGKLETLLLRVDRGLLRNEGELQSAVHCHLQAEQSTDSVYCGR